MVGPDCSRWRERRGRRLRIGAVAMILAALQLRPTNAVAACGSPDIRVLGSASEVKVACAALAAVRTYFVGLGHPVDLELEIVFDEQARIVVRDPVTGRTRGMEDVSGYFDAEAGRVGLTSAWRGRAVARRPWGEPWGEPMAVSILQHELTHAATAEVLGSRYRALGSAWHEFVAYTVQFRLMPAPLRMQILRRYSDFEALPDPLAVNEFNHAADPEGFGVRAYRFAEQRGGDAFIVRILEGDEGEGTLNSDFLWTK